MNYQDAGYKTKEEAIGVALKMLVANPGCAGLDGTCAVMIWGRMYQLRPIKKRKDEQS